MYVLVTILKMNRGFTPETRIKVSVESVSLQARSNWKQSEVLPLAADEHFIYFPANYALNYIKLE